MISLPNAFELCFCVFSISFSQVIQGKDDRVPVCTLDTDLSITGKEKRGSDHFAGHDVRPGSQFIFRADSMTTGMSQQGG